MRKSEFRFASFCLLVLLLSVLLSGCADPRLSAGKGSWVRGTIVQGPNTIVCWGDSMTEGNQGSADMGVYPSILQNQVGPQVVNQGIGGQTSSQIGVRQGAIPTYATVVGGSIPAQGGVTVTFATGYEPLTFPTRTIRGSILGVEGDLTLSDFLPAGKFTFTPVPGSNTPVSVQGTPQFVVDTPYQTFLPVFWEGRNNLIATTKGPWGPAQIESDLAAQIATLPKGLNYLVLGILNMNYPLERKNGANYPILVSFNNALAATYGTRYLDVRTLLVNSYNPSSPVDVTDFQNDMIPTSLGAISGEGTLVGSIGPTDQTFTLNMTNGSLVAYHNLVIDNENIRVLQVSGSTVTKCTRGYGGSMAPHSAGAAIAQHDPTHLNKEGYTIVASAVAKKLASM